MNKRKIQALINRLNDDIEHIRSTTYDISFINGVEFAINKLEMLKESIKD